MRTPGIILFLVTFVAPAAAQDLTAGEIVPAALERVEQSERELERQREQAERDRERLERERERQREQIERDRERQRAQVERERDRARQQIERARARAGDVEEIERGNRTLRIGPGGELHVSNIAGDIVVSRGGGTDAQVEFVKSARGQTSEAARELLKLVEVDVVERAGRAEITTRYPGGQQAGRFNRRNVNASVAFKITVPADTRVRVHSIAGAVSAKDVGGDVVLKSVSGPVHLANGRGACTAESLSGDVEIVDSTFDGSLSASTASGSIVLKRVKARRINVSTISGDLTLESADGPSVDAKSVSGNVQWLGGLAKNARYELGSHSGTITIAVSGGSGFEVQATSFSGSVRSDIPFTNQDPEPARRRFGHSLRGVVGDGSAVLNLSTFSGSIVIQKR